MATGRRIRNGAQSIGSGQEAQHQRAMLNGIVAQAKQEHPRGEGTNMLNVVGHTYVEHVLGILSWYV